MSIFSTAPASTVEHAVIKSMATCAPAAQASLARTVSTRSMSVIHSRASMVESAKMPWNPSGAPALKATQAIAARYTQTCQPSITFLKKIIATSEEHRGNIPI